MENYLEESYNSVDPRIRNAIASEAFKKEANRKGLISTKNLPSSVQKSVKQQDKVQEIKAFARVKHDGINKVKEYIEEKFKKELGGFTLVSEDEYRKNGELRELLQIMAFEKRDSQNLNFNFNFPYRISGIVVITDKQLFYRTKNVIYFCIKNDDHDRVGLFNITGVDMFTLLKNLQKRKTTAEAVIEQIKKATKKYRVKLAKKSVGARQFDKLFINQINKLEKAKHKIVELDDMPEELLDRIIAGLADGRWSSKYEVVWFVDHNYSEYVCLIGVQATHYGAIPYSTIVPYFEKGNKKKLKYDTNLTLSKDVG